MRSPTARAREDFRRKLYGKEVIDAGCPEIPQSAVADSHPQNVHPRSILDQLDLAIILSETALSAPDRNTARRNMVLAKQVLDGAERSVLNCKADVEIETRLDRIQLLLRRYKEAYGQREDKRIITCPSINHDPETEIETLPKDEPIEAARELLTAKDLSRHTAEVLNCRPDLEKQVRSEHTPWHSLLLGLLDKSAAWLMSRV